VIPLIGLPGKTDENLLETYIGFGELKVKKISHCPTFPECTVEPYGFTKQPVEFSTIGEKPFPPT